MFSRPASHKPNRAFHAGVKHMLKAEANVSIRLRSFRGARKASGNGGTGRYVWEKIDSGADVNVMDEERSKKAVQLWEKIKEEK